eukprot:1767939-Rhodomonas_salina.1
MHAPCSEFPRPTATPPVAVGVQPVQNCEVRSNRSILDLPLFWLQSTTHVPFELSPLLVKRGDHARVCILRKPPEGMLGFVPDIAGLRKEMAHEMVSKVVVEVECAQEMTICQVRP